MPPSKEVQKERMRIYRLRKKANLIAPKKTKEQQAVQKKARQLEKIRQRNILEKSDPSIRLTRLAVDTPKRYARGYSYKPKTKRTITNHYYNISWTGKDLSNMKKRLRKI
jgi:hypothetical protein